MSIQWYSLFFLLLCLLILSGCMPRSYKLTTPKGSYTMRVGKVSEFSTVIEKKGFRPHFKKLPEREKLYKSPKEIKEVSELYDVLEYAFKTNNLNQAIKIIEQLILLLAQTNPEEVRILRLQRADIYFDQGNLKKAGLLYSEYIKLYPGSKERDYAEYKGILCRFYARLKPPLDQTKTRKTLALAKAYLRSTSTKLYEEEVKKIQHECYKDLFKYEKGIIKFHFRQRTLQAARERLKELRKEFGSLSMFEPKITKLELALARAEGNQLVVQAKEEELKAKFPASIKVAQNSPRSRYVNRF